MGWVVNTKPWPLYPQERPGTHCIGGWMGAENLASTGIKINKYRNTILPAASCGHETSLLIVRGEPTLRASENRVQRMIFGPW